MSTQYFEIRSSAKSTALAADITRHLHSRQYLGRAMVVCETPLALLSACRKQWLRITRAVQIQRASTLNAEEILRFTHVIMHMQHFIFAARIPNQEQQGHVYFVTPEQFGTLPPECQTIYLTTAVPNEKIQKVAETMQAQGLFVNYETGLTLSSLGLHPKSELEADVLKEWERLVVFLRKHNINPEHLIGTPDQFEQVNEALDTLLTTSTNFLREAASFRHALDLAQPLATISADYMRMFDAITRLAHRVQTLVPNSFSGYMLKSFGEQEGFFLRDVAPESYYAYLEAPDVPPYLITEVMQQD